MKSQKNTSFSKKIFLLIMFIGMAFITKVNAKSAANVNEIMLQAFGWDVHTQSSIAAEGGHYNFLKNRTSAGYSRFQYNLVTTTK